MMEFRPPKLKRLLLVMAMGAMVLPAGAQQSSQPIIFSSPQDRGRDDRPTVAVTGHFAAGNPARHASGSGHVF